MVDTAGEGDEVKEKEAQAEGEVEGETEGEVAVEVEVTAEGKVTAETVAEGEGDGADKVEVEAAVPMHVESPTGDGSSGSSGGRDSREPGGDAAATTVVAVAAAAAEVLVTEMVEPAEPLTAAEEMHSEGIHEHTADPQSEAADVPESSAAAAAAAAAGAATAAAAGAAAATAAAAHIREPSEEELVQRAMAMSLDEERETAAIKAAAGETGGDIGETLNPTSFISNQNPSSKTLNLTP